jgi:hypothetical protein
MLSSRLAAHTRRALEASRSLRSRSQHIRFQSTQPPSSNHTNAAILGGLIGGGITLIGGYTWYRASGAHTVVSTAHSTKEYFETAQKRFTENAPRPNEALRWLRQVSTYYAGFVPGASGYVESALNDLDRVHDKHGEEVDKIIGEAYEELKGVSNQGLSLETAAKTWDVLQKHLKRIAELAGDAAEDVLNNHPEIKKSLGGSVDELKRMGEQYGPEAKKQVDETWDQIKEITKSGLSPESGEKISKLVKEKVAQVQKLGDEAWKKGLEKAEPYFEKNPKIKELVESNAKALKQGNFGELFDKVKEAAQSGNTEDLEKFVKSAAGKAQDSFGAGLEQILKSVPGGDQVVPKLRDLQEIAEKNGEEAKKLFEETINEVSQILSKKADQAKDLAKDSEKKAK